MDEITIHKFFQALCPSLNGHIFELRRLRGAVQNFCRTVDEATTIAAADRGRNCYFGVALRDGQQGDRGHAALIPVLWADLDWKDYEGAGRRLVRFLRPLNTDRQSWWPLATAGTSIGCCGSRRW